MSTFGLEMRTTKPKATKSKAIKPKSIGELLFPRLRRQLLTVLLITPENRYYFRELSRLVKSSTGSLKRELVLLTDAGIVRTETMGRQHYYQADLDCMIHAELRSIVIKTFGVVGSLAEALRPLETNIQLACVYGSIAASSDTGKSDVDLLVVGNLTFRKLTAALAGVEQTLGRQVNAALFSLDEFSSKLEDKNHFLQTILNSEKLFVIGSPDDIGRMAKK
ncbi:MAG: hypothetical protein AAB305_00165 [Candidatus Zixiibacteriota bacterium]